MKKANRIKLGYKVAKGNELIQRAKSDLSLTEQKLIAYVVSMIKPTDNEFQRYEIKVSDFSEIIGSSSKNTYAELKELIDSLDDKAFWIKIDNKYIKFRWFSESTYMIDQGTIQVVLNSEIKKHLINLSKNFTSYELYNVMALKSKYSIRLYELVKSYEYKKVISMEIDALKESLSAIRYTSYKDFKRRVLLPAVNEINMYTDVWLAFECLNSDDECMTSGRGKKITSLRFHISFKEPFEKYEGYLQVVRKLENKKRKLAS